jgi:hypothetical protein
VVAVIASLLAVQLIACGSNAKSTVGDNANLNTGGNNPTDGGSNVNTSVQLTAIAVTPADTSVAAGMPIRFTATGTFSDGSTQDVTGAVVWVSADTSCAVAGATANELQTQTGCANANPFAVTATDAATGVVGTTTLTVVQQALDYIAIDQIDPTILVGTSLQLTVTGYFPDGSAAAVSDVAWVSSNPSVVSVDPDGTVHGLLLSSTPTTITASATDPTNGATFSDTTNVYVTDVPHALSYMTLTPGSVRSGSTRVVTGSIFLTSPAVAPKDVTLTGSDNGSILVMPPGVTIDPGKTSATFQVTVPTAIDKRTKVTVTATSEGEMGPEAKTARLNVRKGR